MRNYQHDEIYRSREMARVKLAAQKQKEAARAKKAAERQRKAELDAAEERASAARALLEREFSDKELGQGCKNGGGTLHRQARRDFLDRCRLRYRPLPAELEEIWPAFRDQFANDIAKQHKDKTGSFCVIQFVGTVGPFFFPHHPFFAFTCPYFEESGFPIDAFLDASVGPSHTS